jgi:hypothetical protein
MDSEIVRITLGENSYIVDASFSFLNSGKTVKLSVGFPKNGEGLLDDRFTQVIEFIKFETWVDGREVDFIEAPGIASVEDNRGQYTLPDLIRHIKNTPKRESLDVYSKDYRWMVKKEVVFPSREMTTTRVRYEAPYQDLGYCKGLTYIYGTGSYWNGNIGESKFILDATGIPQDKRPRSMDFLQEKDKSKIICTTLSDAVIQCVIKNYKPATSTAKIVVRVGCPD